MNEGLLLVERMVLESIGKGKNRIEDIVGDTKLSAIFVENIIANLIKQKIINVSGDEYHLNENSNWKELVNNKSVIKEEVKELFVALINQYFLEEKKKTKLKVRKVWLTPFEDKVLQSHFYNLEQFIQSVEKRNQREEPQHKKRVILWGDGHYRDLVDGLVAAS